jgi:hypothetical protein
MITTGVSGIVTEAARQGAPAASGDGRAKTEASAPEPVAISTAAPPGPLFTPRLRIEFDVAAERFVQTLVDPTSQSVLRRFPAENQLAFSRGVNAYMAALQRASSGVKG